ncbi:hypothetical protein AE618_13095 [Bosea vaviloviae]|uniref:Uncharacterized protein n=1 Tax=Bosea vaviloviae TaxID=1526658 RepID=A0A0N0MBA9_9HYPH|nr:hypothetical protein AE618_13095 [Bosea vaviloviae]
MKTVICHTLKGVARQGSAAGQTGLAPPPYSPPFRGGVRVGQERSAGVAHEAGEVLAQLAARVDRLTISHRDPEAFFVERSEIAAALRGAAERVPLPVQRAGQAVRSVSLASKDLAPKVSGRGR